MGVSVATVVVALLVNSGAALLALWRGAISPSGAVTAAAVGWVILALGGAFAWAMLMLFFLTSTLASRAGRRRKHALAGLHEKGSRRDAAQVLANGGVAALAVLLFGATGHAAFLVAAAGALAGANADTWASEFGVLAGRPPRSIVTGRRLPPGTSGGVSAAGTLAAFAGSALIAVWVAALGPQATGVPAWAALIVLAAGFLGSTVDSLLGAAVQAQYEAADGSRTERRASGGLPNRLVRGWRWVTNDAVNFACTTVAAAAAGTAYLLV